MRAWPDEQRGLALSTPGFVILAHENLDRVAEQARYLSLHGPVVIHVDARVPAAPVMGLGPRIDTISTRECGWGQISLVDATLDAVRHLLDQHDVGHVCLLSGSCLPVRPLGDLSAFLAAHPEVDFIDTVPVDQAQWVQGGLGAERFRYWFPLNWKTRRWAFDRLVQLQRRLRVHRRMPDGLVPHLGLQWWCLTAKTLRALLDHPKLPTWRRYFAWTWIPDESFFQTLVHTVSQGDIRSQPLTLQRFDHNGRPFVFHDDHADLLCDSEYFFARKIDADADVLYTTFLSDPSSVPAPRIAFDGTLDETPFHQARERGWQGGRGLLGPSKMTSGTTLSYVETVGPYAVLVSRNNDLMRAVRKACLGPDIRFHGHLFGEFPTDFADDFPVLDGLGPGCLPTEPALRDYRAAQFLAKVLWIGRDRPAAFLFHPSDHRMIRGTIYSDENARLILLGDAEDLLGALAEPPKNRKGRPMRASVRRAWHCRIDAEAGDAVAQALKALSSDWHDDSGWTRPGKLAEPRS